jgi:hypothetical protein
MEIFVSKNTHLKLVNINKPIKLIDVSNEWAKFYEEIYGGRLIQTNISQLHRIYNYLEGFDLLSKSVYGIIKM